MPFAERTVEAIRHEFAVLASREGANLSELCRRYGVSRPTGRLWRDRYREQGAAGLVDQSRRPHQSPGRTAPEVEATVLALRAQHPAWGGRKLAAALARQGLAAPAPSTITAILQRYALLTPDADAPRRWQRFEHPTPNDLWQLDFMGHRPVENGQRVHPLTVLDDHSRFALGLIACPHERQAAVQTHLTACFQRYGLPHAILADNGPPWGTSGAGGITALEAWLLRLGVELWHGRAYHPQTQGKIERFHGTIAAEVFAHHTLPDLAAAQRRFDAWRRVYNGERPHQALDGAVPLERYTPSPRPFPDPLPPLGYGPDDMERTVREQGAISFAGHAYFISRGLSGQRVAVRPTMADGVFAVVYCTRQVATIDVRERPRG